MRRKCKRFLGKDEGDGVWRNVFLQMSGKLVKKWLSFREDYVFNADSNVTNNGHE